MARSPRDWQPQVIGSALALLLLALAAPTEAQAQPAFSKTFAPDAIGPGSTTTLTFVINNAQGATPATNLAFTDVLPAAVTIADPASASTTCTGAVLSAPGGGTTISLSGGSVGAGQTCTVQVNVTSSTVGVHMNVSGALTSSAGNSGTAADDLTVDALRPGFLKLFSPSTVNLGGRSTLTFTIDNTENDLAVWYLEFTDTLPAGLEIASPANAATTCGTPTVPPTLTATPGTSVISLLAQGTASFPAVASAATCTVTVDVVATIGGLLHNVSGELMAGQSNIVSSGRATDTLVVTLTELALLKSFTDDPTPPGGLVRLEFTILNRFRDFPATGVAFNDPLNAPSGLAPEGPLPATPCGASSALSFTSGVLSLTGGTVAAGGSCTFAVDLRVPAATAAGSYVNTTNQISGTIDGAPVTGNAAADTLFVAPVPRLTKTFIGSPVGAGGNITLRFSIQNTSTTSSATDITFLDELTTFLPFPIVATLPTTPCGAGSSMALVTLGTDQQALELSDGVLGSSGVCTFDVGLTLPAGLPGGVYTNTTGVITATVNGATRTGNPATASFDVLGAPMLTKEFTNDPVLPGGQVTLAFTLTHDATAPAGATGITFTDNLAATLSGLAAINLPLNDVCGTGSQISGTTLLTLSGGSLAPGGACTFNVTLQVPAGAASGTYANTTSNVSAQVMGQAVAGSPAQDSLVIPSLVASKAFGGPVVPGGTVSLTFNFQNVTADPITSITFTDDLTAALAGLTATGTPLNNICGAGSTLSGTTTLTFTGGSLAAGASCNFSVTVQVPAGAADGQYVNRTSSISFSLGGSPRVVGPASALLVVDSNRLRLSKQFVNDPVAPGGTTTLEFTITNLDAGLAATSLSFTDNLGATLAGLVASGLPMSNVCGAGSQLAGTSVITLTGGNLAASATCTFSLTLQVPAGAAAGTYANTTSEVTGMAGGLTVRGAPAQDNLLVSSVAFSKTFAGPVRAGGTVSLSFTLTNLTAVPVGSLGFVDNLDAVVAGLAAVGLPAANVCGAGSTLSGTSLLTFSAGSLPASGTCTFNVTLQVPGSAAPGTYVNTTSDLRADGLPVSSPAVANLVVDPTPPAFTKAFGPATIVAGGISTLTFTINNTASPVAATALAFTDNLPAALRIANPANASITCTGGTLTAVAGTGTISYTGGTAGAQSSCTIRADVTSNTPGAHLNVSGALTSSLGSSGTASATLTVTAAPTPTGGLATGPGEGAPPLVRFFNAARTERSGMVFDPSFTGGVRVALGDVNGDGVADVIVGAGPGAGPHVKVFSGTDASLLHSFLAFPAGFTGGVFVAAGDVNNDGRDDIVTGAGAGGTPQVKVFSGLNLQVLHDFFAFPAGFRGGVRVASGDVDGDGRDDIIVGAGPGGSPLVRVGRVLPNGTLSELASGLAYEAGFTGGVFVAAGDVDGDGHAEVVIGPDQGRAPLVHVVSLAPDGRVTDVQSGLVYPAGFLGGVRVAAGNVDAAGVGEVVVGPGPGDPQPVRVLSVSPGPLANPLVEFFAYGPGFRRGVFVAAP